MAQTAMIKGHALLRWFSLQSGAKRYRIQDEVVRPYEIICERSREFEELILILFLIDKYYSGEDQLSFGTQHKNLFEETRDIIEDLYYFLTRRKLSIRFVQVQRQVFQQQQIVPGGEVRRRGAPCLFSGGLDSASGALVLTKRRLFPTLTHTATGNIVYGQARRLKEHFMLRSLPMIMTDMRLHTRARAADSSQIKTRGLLFLSNALSIASSMRSNQVYMAENGPLMVNPRVSSLSDPTRNTHPYLVATLERIYNHITQSKVRIVPMFKDNTKAEIVAQVLHDDIIDRTWSCFRIQGQSRMCGLCFACFVRRLSVLAVDYEEPLATYERDMFLGEKKDLSSVSRIDLDILHDTFLFLEKLLLDNRSIRDNMFMIPDGFFNDEVELLRNFALDIFLGVRNYLKRSGTKTMGLLGRFAMKALKRVSKSYLKQREDRLSSIADLAQK